MISKSLSTSEKFASLLTAAGDLAEFCQVLYPLIVTHTDDFGRLQGDVFTVKHMCFPASPRSLEEFATALARLHEVELIIWYTVAGKRYVQIEQFDNHQLGLHKRTRSAFPRVPGISGNDAEVPGQEKRREEKGTEGNTPIAPLRGGRRRRGRSDGVTGGSVCCHVPCCPTTKACIELTLGRKAS